MGDYMNFYLFTDVLILIEAFQKFREVIFNTHQLDPAYFNTLPSMSIQAAMLDSNIEIDLIKDPAIYTMFESNIRGG